ncbi:MAG: pyrrolo-quinoline quinone [Gemmatimonadetes bacterium]|nr:pyrrolo-quinoline quinone [Gemmatimonadota bacterium]
MSQATRIAFALVVAASSIVAGQSGGTNWIGYNGSYSGDRYSPLAEITPQNVSRLTQTCVFDTHEAIGFQTAPTVVAGVMYITTDTSTYAFDARTCAPKWRNSRAYAPLQFLANNRGATYMDGRLFRMGGDVHAYAIDASNGRTVWDVSVGDQSKGESAPLAPVAWNHMVFVGNAGGDNFGVTGRIYALDAGDGHVLWKFDVVPTSGPARRTWTKASAQNPPTGGATWTSYALDTTRGVLYASTGNPAPDFVAALHPGENLYTTAIVALDARTGHLVAYVQPITGDFHDWDVAAPAAIIDTRGGKHLLIASGKEGMVYGIDRSRPGALTVLYKTPVTTRSNVTQPFSAARWTHFCPGTQGGSEWNGAAYDPGQNLVYVPAIDWCTSIKLQRLDTLKGKVGTPWTGMDDPQAAFGRMDPKEKWQGWITAVNPDDGQVKWKYRSPTPMLAGVTATRGGVVFTGDVDGNVLALDAKTGALLWKAPTNNAIGGGVISYGIGGKQYVAAAAGMKSVLWPVPNQSARVVVYALP